MFLKARDDESGKFLNVVTADPNTLAVVPSNQYLRIKFILFINACLYFLVMHVLTYNAPVVWVGLSKPFMSIHYPSMSNKNTF